jgi:hypothetical protein
LKTECEVLTYPVPENIAIGGACGPMVMLGVGRSIRSMVNPPVIVQPKVRNLHVNPGQEESESMMTELVPKMRPRHSSEV